MAQSKSQLFVNKNWNEKRRYKVNSVVSYLGASYQNQTGFNSTPGVGLDWKLVTSTSDMASFDVFEFVQKGYGNVDLDNYQTGDIFRGWKNDGTERWPEAIWNGGALNDSDNFTPLVQVEI